MQASLRERLRAATSMWSRHLLVLAVTVFLSRLGQGLLGGVSTNFFKGDLDLTDTQVLWLAGIREIPGLSLIFVAALIMHLPLSQRAIYALLLMGLGYGLYAIVHSYAALIAVALAASLGFHNWMPLQSSLALALTKKEHSGRVMGALASVGALASIAGMTVTALLARALDLRVFYLVGGLAIVCGALLVSRIPTTVGERTVAQSRMILKWRYWLYYVLIFFEGSRMQVFGAFGTLILVTEHKLDASQISLLLVVSGILNFGLAPRLGHLLDVVGERITLSVSYVLLALCFIGYAAVPNVWFMSAMLVLINLLVTLRIGLSTYVNRIAPPEELTPTLTAGVSINHITSVSMSFLAGSLLPKVGYKWLCIGAATMIMLSVPFALAIKTAPRPTQAGQPAVDG